MAASLQGPRDTQPVLQRGEWSTSLGHARIWVGQFILTHLGTGRMPVESHMAAGKEVACQLLSFAECFAELWTEGGWSPSLLGQFIRHL